MRKDNNVSTIRDNIIKKPWLATVLCFFLGPIGLFYFGWRPGIGGLILFGSVTYFFEYLSKQLIEIPPWALPSVLFIWAYAGWRYAKSWNIQNRHRHNILNYFGTFDAGIVATSYVAWLNILISLPVVSVFIIINAKTAGKMSTGIVFALLWLSGGFLWFYIVGKGFILPWAHRVHYLHFSKKKLNELSFDTSDEIRRGNDPQVAAIMGLFFNGLGYLYFHWRYAVLGIGTFIIFNFIMYLCGIIRIGFAIQPPEGFIWLLGLVFAWKGYKIALVRQILLDSGETTLSELNSFSFAGMATSELVVALGKFYAGAITIWISIDFFRNAQILRGILCLVIALPLAIWLANLIFGLVSDGLSMLFYKKYEKNVFRT